MRRLEALEPPWIRTVVLTVRRLSVWRVSSKNTTQTLQPPQSWAAAWLWGSLGGQAGPGTQETWLNPASRTVRVRTPLGREAALCYRLLQAALKRRAIVLQTAAWEWCTGCSRTGWNSWMEQLDGNSCSRTGCYSVTNILQRSYSVTNRDVTITEILP